jgi:mono/diheme cytochrome c family protein
VTGLPAKIDITPYRLSRGRERFDIYCAPCHGYDGQGHGTVPTRLEKVGASWAVANLTLADKVTLPNGQIFNTISNGRNTMRGYASQIPVEDRWDIVLYVRALQRSQHPSAGDRQ